MSKTRLVSSVVDRLLERSDSPVALPGADGDDLGRLMREVGRDLEALLNTRRRCLVCPPELHYLTTSLLEYGIPDFTGLNLSLPSEREQTREAIERAIREFEPRLKNVVVTVMANMDQADRRLRLRITGVLQTRPSPARVEFDSEVDRATAAIDVHAVS
jgi:type VI secretion system protein ImpF